MKRFICILMCFVLLSAFTACTYKNNVNVEAPAGTDAQNATDVPEETCTPYNGETETVSTPEPAVTDTPDITPENTATQGPVASGTPEATPAEKPTDEPSAEPTAAPTASATEIHTGAPTEVPTGTPEGNELVTYFTSGTFSPDREPSKVSDEFKTVYADIALRLLELCDDVNGAFVSPLSIITAILMTANGAKGDTLNEMMDALFGGMTVEEANAQLFNYYRSLVNSENASLEDANAIFFSDSEGFSVNPDFVKLVQNTFDAEIAKASFPDKETVDLINDWCDEHTAGMIKKVLEYEDVSEDTVMVLLNALCFRALWADQYADQAVRDGTFRGADGETDVKMLCGENHYIKGEHEEGFIQYYEGYKYAFVALLPEKGIAVSDYIKTLKNGRFKALIDQRKGLCDSEFPVFSFDMAILLNDALQELGIHTAFSDYSDLSGLGTLESGDNIKISKVIHKTHIEVDQSGTKAAAVTAIINRATAIGPEPNPKVVFDRPFVYAIVDTESMLPIFIGSLSNIK